MKGMRTILHGIYGGTTNIFSAFSLVGNGTGRHTEYRHITNALPSDQIVMAYAILLQQTKKPLLNVTAFVFVWVLATTTHTQIQHNTSLLYQGCQTGQPCNDLIYW